jgi:hypothetical protein
MKPIIEWIKGNVVTVIFVAVMIGALVALPIVSGRLNKSVQESMEQRVKKLRELDGLEKTTFEIGEINQNTLINRRLLDRYREVTAAEHDDAELVVALAEQHNRHGRGVLRDNVFPAIPPSERETLPKRYWETLIGAYEGLLAQVEGAEPPSPEAMADEIERRRVQFLSRMLAKEATDELTEEEATEVREALIKARFAKYGEVAEAANFYVTKDALALPAWDQTAFPTPADLYDWQWRYWIVEDILLALDDANEGSESVLRAPVKRVLEITVWPEELGSSGGNSGGGSPGFGGTAPGFGAARPATPAAPPGGAPVNPAAVAPLNYNVSFTGRSSNPLYDVRRVTLRLVVATERLPEVLDAIARRNFITVLDLNLAPADHYAAASDGFLYGSQPVSEIRLDLETIWLRSWTGPFMPESVRQARGMPAAQPATVAPGAPAAPGGAPGRG